MILSYRIFDYAGTALTLPLLDMMNLRILFEENREVKRVEVYERAENQTIWDETYLTTYYSKDFK